MVILSIIEFTNSYDTIITIKALELNKIIKKIFFVICVHRINRFPRIG
jgi:hypothetical protein